MKSAVPKKLLTQWDSLAWTQLPNENVNLTRSLRLGDSLAQLSKAEIDVEAPPVPTGRRRRLRDVYSSLQGLPESLDKRKVKRVKKIGGVKRNAVEQLSNGKSVLESFSRSKNERSAPDSVLLTQCQSAGVCVQVNSNDLKENVRKNKADVGRLQSAKAASNYAKPTIQDVSLVETTNAANRPVRAVNIKKSVQQTTQKRHATTKYRKRAVGGFSQAFGLEGILSSVINLPLNQEGNRPTDQLSFENTSNSALKKPACLAHDVDQTLAISTPTPTQHVKSCRGSDLAIPCHEAQLDDKDIFTTENPKQVRGSSFKQSQAATDPAVSPQAKSNVAGNDKNEDSNVKDAKFCQKLQCAEPKSTAFDNQIVSHFPNEKYNSKRQIRAVLHPEKLKACTVPTNLNVTNSKNELSPCLSEITLTSSFKATTSLDDAVIAIDFNSPRSMNVLLSCDDDTKEDEVSRPSFMSGIKQSYSVNVLGKSTIGSNLKCDAEATKEVAKFARQAKTFCLAQDDHVMHTNQLKSEEKAAEHRNTDEKLCNVYTLDKTEYCSQTIDNVEKIDCEKQQPLPSHNSLVSDSIQAHKNCFAQLGPANSNDHVLVPNKDSAATEVSTTSLENERKGSCSVWKFSSTERINYENQNQCIDVTAFCNGFNRKITSVQNENYKIPVTKPARTPSRFSCVDKNNCEKYVTNRMFIDDTKVCSSQQQKESKSWKTQQEATAVPLFLCPDQLNIVASQFLNLVLSAAGTSKPSLSNLHESSCHRNDMECNNIAEQLIVRIVEDEQEITNSEVQSVEEPGAIRQQNARLKDAQSHVLNSDNGKVRHSVNEQDVRRSKRVRSQPDRFAPNQDNKGLLDSAAVDSIAINPAHNRKLQRHQTTRGTLAKQKRIMNEQKACSVKNQFARTSLKGADEPVSILKKPQAEDDLNDHFLNHETHGKNFLRSTCTKNERLPLTRFNLQEKNIGGRSNRNDPDRLIERINKLSETNLTFNANADLVNAKHRHSTSKVPLNDQSKGSLASDNWTPRQMNQLRAAHSVANPTDPKFWWEVAFFVDGKSANECQLKWFSLVKTPQSRIGKKLGKKKIPCLQASVDNIFDSTPMKTLHSISDKLTCANISASMQKSLNNPGFSQEERLDSPTFPNDLLELKPRPGQKSYLERMRREIRADNKRKRKRKDVKIGLKRLQLISASAYEGDIAMAAQLSPGGTFKTKKVNEWPELDDNNDDQSDNDTSAEGSLM